MKSGKNKEGATSTTILSTCWILGISMSSPLKYFAFLSIQMIIGTSTIT